MNKFSIPRQTICKSSPCDPDLKLRFYNFYVKTGTIKKTSDLLGIPLYLVSKVLLNEVLSKKTKERIKDSLDRVEVMENV